MKTLGKFQYLSNCRERKALQLTFEKFCELIKSTEIQNKIIHARACLEKDDVKQYQTIKNTLPAIMWCGYNEQGERVGAKLLPTGFFMVDVDHCKNGLKARELYFKIANQMGEENFEKRVLLAHLTPSGKGLRIVMKAKDGMKHPNEAMQDFVGEFPICKEYGDFDTAVHDYSRLSFIVPKRDFLYINNNMFEEQFETTFENFGVENSTPNVSKDVTAQTEEQSEEQLSEEQKIFETYEYNGVLVSDIVNRYVEKYGKPQEGERHNYYNTLVKNFRNICNNDPKVLHAILPRFGNSFKETSEQCKSICKTNNSTMLPKDFFFFLVSEGFIKKQVDKEKTEEELNAEIEEKTASEEIQTDNSEILKQLGTIPPVFREFVSICPKDFVFPTITALLPIMGTMTSYLRSRYLDGVEQSTSFFSVLYAPPSSSKSFVQRLMDLLFRKLYLRDEINDIREQIYVNERDERTETEKKPKNPHTTIRIFPAINSQAEFLSKMRDNKGYHMFTLAEEVDTFNKGTKAAGGDKSDLFRIAWDNGKYGQAFKGSGTFKGNVKLYYNILLTGTVGQVRKYYKDVENGMVTRVSYSEIENQTFAAFEAWKQLSTKQKNVIKAFVDRTDEKTYKSPCDFDMDELRNMDEEAFKADAPWQMEYRNFENIDMSWFFPTIQNWLEVQRKKSIEAVDFARDTFRRRAALKGFRMAMVCTQCWSAFGKREQKIVSDFVVKWMNYDLESSLRLFGDMFNNNIQETQVKKVAFNSLFDAMPDEFNLAELSAKARQMFIKSNTRQIIYAWCKIKLIEPCLDENDKKIYRKVKPKNKKK